MKKLLIACMLLLVSEMAGAQKVYFIYIQSDSNTPFFVKLGDKIVSASASGYVILPNLVDSVYQLTIGKTGEATAEAQFSIPIKQQDKGFLLREANGTFSLFDLQAMTSLQPVTSASTSNKAVGKRTDAFAVLLAQAANDPSLLEIHTAVATTQHAAKESKTAIALATPKTPDETAPKDTEPDTSAVAAETTAPVAEPDITGVAKKSGAEALDETSRDTTQQAETLITDVAKTETANPDTTQQAETAGNTNDDSVNLVAHDVEAPIEGAASEAQPYKRSVVTRKSESSTTEGFGLVFLDEAEGTTDTIRILIPNQTLVYDRNEAEDADVKKFLNITNTDTIKTPDQAVAEANEKLRVAESRKRKPCAEVANDKEFFRLRKNMAAEDSEDAMITEAKKAFRKACFSTAQIKNLSSLFLTASGKYQFFDAAYGHVSNQEQYASLQTELNDVYYVNRFKALIENQ